MTNLTPRAWYTEALAHGQLQADAAQAELFAALQRTFEAVCARHEDTDDRWAKLKSFLSREPARAVPGLYIWGGVGRGKTLAMNVFFDTLPVPTKSRMHFHSFMQRVHGELATLSGEDPLTRVAERLVADHGVLCIDEFQVSDIGDAMILAGLLRALFARGVVLVTTSNIEPRGLYKDGLQRAQFLPAIALLESHTQVIELTDGPDYRLRTLERAQIYHCPLGKAAEESIRACFDALCPIDVVRNTELTVAGRTMRLRACAEGVLWVEFSQLCDGPRANADYIEIARRFHTVLISNVPLLDDGLADQALRFIHAIDEFYDRHVNLILSAAAQPDELYNGTKLADRFARTASRLFEMRSHDYLAHAHAARGGDR